MLKKLLIIIGLFSYILFLPTAWGLGPTNYAEDTAALEEQQFIDEANAEATGNAEAAANASSEGEPTQSSFAPDGTDLGSLDETPTGIRIDNTFKPINAPDAINQNYGTDTVNAFLQFIAGSLIEIVSGLAIFAFVIAGYMFVTAGVNESQIEKAKEVIKYTIIGLFVIILSYTIVKTVISLLLETNAF